MKHEIVEPAFEVYELTVSNLDVTFNSWKTNKKNKNMSQEDTTGGEDSDSDLEILNDSDADNSARLSGIYKIYIERINI